MVNRRKSPQACLLKKKGDGNSTLLGGVYINVSALARSIKVDQSYLSRIFSGERKPSLEHAKAMAAGLGMSIDDFIEVLDDRIKLITATKKQKQEQYQALIAAQDAADTKRMKAGKPVSRRLSALRIAS